MLKGPTCLVPTWKDFQLQISERLTFRKDLPDTADGSHILLSDRPSIVFRDTCHPTYMPIICHYTSERMHYFASFTWRRAKRSKVLVWIYSPEGEVPVTKTEYTMEQVPEVYSVTHVAHVNLFVAYCDDSHFRFFGDHTQDFKLLSDMTSPYLITSMCYSPETGELVSGAIGVMAFWSFGAVGGPCMSITQEVNFAAGEFVHFLRVEQEQRVLVVLCENVIQVYDCQTKAHVRTFQMSHGVSLTCCAVNWLQSFLYTGDLAGDVKVWDFDTGSHVNQFKAHLNAIRSIIIRTAVQTVMTASLDGKLKEWNLTTCELLRRVDIGEEVFQMAFLSEQTFFLQTKYTFSIRTVNNFYQLFNRTKSVLQKLVRVQCGQGKARILAATEDGVIRFLSPVTGEMLFVTWPFQLLEKALDYVYDPDREELLVTIGTADIYVLDTSKNPCPAKYIVRTTDSSDDRVLCLAYSQLDLRGRPTSFVFSGYKSGKVCSVTQQLYRMGGRRIHDGNVVALSSLSSSGSLSVPSRESSYLCSYGIDEYIILSQVILKRNHLLEVLPLVIIPSISCRINNLLLIPGYICVLTEENRVRLWRQAALVPGQRNPFWVESKAMHSSTITSFDYCHTLRMLVTGGSDGSVRIWDILGRMLVEFDTSLKFSRVCFANQRGDLVVGCNMNIYFIPCVTYLPKNRLALLLSQCLQDDAVEEPLPFLPRFLLSFDVVFVPKYRQVGKQAKKYERLEPISNRKEVVLEKNVAKVVDFLGKDASALPGPRFYELPSLLTKEIPPEVAVEYQLSRKPSSKASLEKKTSPAEAPLPPPPYRGLPRMVEQVPLLRTLLFHEGHTWPVAPDGYIPNSVVRAQLFPTGTPLELWCPLESSRDPLPTRKVMKIQMAEWDKSELVEKARKKKAQKMRQVSSIVRRPQDLLAEIVTKPWLRHKPSDTTLPSVLKAILNLMDDVPYSNYLLCTSALVQITEAYALPPHLKEAAFERLIQDTNHKEGRMRLAAWEALGKMDLLRDHEITPLARALLDDNKKVRDLARSLIDAVTGVTDKFALEKELKRVAESSLQDLDKQKQAQQASKFPRRVRAAGIVAQNEAEAVYALTEGAADLLARLQDHLTANLFLMDDGPLPEVPSSARLLPFRRSRPSGKYLQPELHLQAEREDLAHWPSPFGQPLRKAVKAPAVPEAAKQPVKTRLPRIQKARPKEAVAPESSSSSSSSRRLRTSSSSSTSAATATSGTSSSSVWEEVRRFRKDLKRKEPKKKALPTPFHEARKHIKESRQPVFLQSRDTRTQLYTEMKGQKEKLAAGAPEAAKAPTLPLQPKPSTVLPPVAAPPAAKGTLIDPNQHYSLEKSRWRSDLLKLMALRIAPSVEGLTVAEDLLASARMALSGRALSWELFSSLTQALSLRSSQEKLPTDKEGWRRYMEDLRKASLQETWQPSSGESLERVVAVKTAKGLFSSSEASSTGLSQEKLGKERRRKGEGSKAQEKPGAEARKAPQGLSERATTKRMAKRLAAREGEETTEEEEEDLGTSSQEEEPPRDSLPGEAPLKVRERAAARRRKGEAAPERPEKEVTRRKPGELVGEGEEVEWGEEEEEEEEEEEQPSQEEEGVEEELLLAEAKRAWELLSEGALAEFRAQARDRVLGELQGRAMEEIMEEAKARALTETRQALVVEAGERAVQKAREMALAEAREAALAKAHEEALAEVMEQALEMAWDVVRAEGLEGEMAEERARELGRAIAEELAKDRAQELASFLSLEVDEARVLALAEEQLLEVDEERLLELAEGRALELAEERLLELVEMKARELAEATALEIAKGRARELAKGRAKGRALETAEGRALETAEGRALEMAEGRALELAEERLLELLEMKALEMAEARALKLAKGRALETAEGRVLEMAEVRDLELVEAMEQEKKLLVLAERRAEVRAQLLVEAKALEREMEREEQQRSLLWDTEEDILDEKIFSLLTEEEREALLTLWEMDRAPEGSAPEGRAEVVPEAELSEYAQMLLMLLTEPEKLQQKDTETLQCLFRVLSLLRLDPATEVEEMAEALLQKAEEILRKGEALRKGELSKRQATVFEHLRGILQVHTSSSTSPEAFAAQIQKLLQGALAVMWARNMKERLSSSAWSKAWQQKAERNWRRDIGKALGRRAWLETKLKQAVGEVPAEEELSPLERQEQKRQERRLKFKARPIILGFTRARRLLGRIRGEDVEGFEEEEEEEEGEWESFPESRDWRRKQGKLSWSLGRHQAATAFHTIMQMEKDWPSAVLGPRHRRSRLPRDYLYKATKPTVRPPRRLFRRGGWQHIFRLQEGLKVDWEKFMEFYQTITTLKEAQSRTGSALWQERASKLLGLYGMSNPLVRVMMQQLLVGDRHQYKYVVHTPLKLRTAPAHLGQRILYELILHSARLQPPQPALHGVFPLSYQNNVHPYKLQGTAHFGPLHLKWKTFVPRGRTPRLSLYVYSRLS